LLVMEGELNLGEGEEGDFKGRDEFKPVSSVK
jgi:hypothetical protein